MRSSRLEFKQVLFYTLANGQPDGHPSLNALHLQLNALFGLSNTWLHQHHQRVLIVGYVWHLYPLGVKQFDGVMGQSGREAEVLANLCFWVQQAQHLLAQVFTLFAIGQLLPQFLVELTHFGPYLPENGSSCQSFL